MLNDWFYWLSTKHPEQLLLFLWAFVLFDTPRYAISKLFMFFYDFFSWKKEEKFDYCPTVCVILSGYNEESVIYKTLDSIWGSYPKLEIIVIDDGSIDSTLTIAKKFAECHEKVLILRREKRGGKASAVNFGLCFTKAEIIVVADTDSYLSPNAIWEIVQPLKDTKVGAVSGTLKTSNPFSSLVSCCQAYEYLNSIFVGRMLSARLGILGIVSGAWGAFRREALERTKGMDVGPPEDLDMTLKIRKSGYEIANAPYAICYTEVPESWLNLLKQRRRWDQGGAIRNHCRKHLDMACFWHKNFSWTNFFTLSESWLFNFIFTYVNLLYFSWLFFWLPFSESLFILLSLYIIYFSFDFLQVITILYYTNEFKKDCLICLVFPLIPIYQFLLFWVRVLATTEEWLFRRSYDDNYVPLHVRQRTWQW